MKDIKNCVVGIVVDGVLRGTGYLATKELVITCAHVVSAAPKPPTKGISVRFHFNDEEFPVKVLKDCWSPTGKDDIAVLKLTYQKGKALPADAEIAALGPSAGRKNHECEVFGYPVVANINGLGGAAKIIQYVKDDTGRELIQLESNQVTCGYSGSPLYDPVTHEVIGTIVEIAEQALARYSPDLHGRLDKLAFATPMEAIKKIAPGLKFNMIDAGGVAGPRLNGDRGIIANDDLFVQLFVATNGKHGRIGTAFPVAKNVLLTSSYVVDKAQAGHIEARWWNLADCDCNGVSCETILWDGRQKSPACDVVLLGCTFPDAAEGCWGRVAAIRPKGNTVWESVAFPFFGERVADPVRLQGITHAMEEGAAHFSLTLRALSEKIGGWKGGAGSPVIVNESIVGVIVDTPDSSDGTQFRACPVVRLLEDADFRLWVNYSEAEDQRQQLVDAGVDVLSQSEEAMKLLSSNRRLGGGTDLWEMATKIVDDLVAHKNPVDVAKCFVTAMRKIPAAGASTSQTRQYLMDAAMHLIPASLTRMQVPQIRVYANDGIQQFAFEARTKTFVEVAVARLQGRPAQYYPLAQDHPQNVEPDGLFRLDSPVEAEIDADGEKFKLDFLHGLHDAMALPQSKSHNFEEQLKQINRALTLRQGINEGLHYYVFEFPWNEDQRARRLPIVRELDDSLPLLTFIGIEKDQRSDEEDSCVDLLMRILFAAAGKEWKQDAQIKVPKRPRNSN